MLKRLAKAYGSIRIGDPSEAGVLCGPLHTKAAVEAFEKVRSTIWYETDAGCWPMMLTVVFRARGTAGRQ